MSQPPVVAGTTSYITYIKIFDSSVTTGAGLTGITNASSGLTAYYKRSNGTAAVQIATINDCTLGTYNGSATACAIKLVSDANMPGVYEFHVPNNALASGATGVVIQLKGVTNMAQCDFLIPIWAINPQDTVRAGLTALPNAASGSAGAIITSGTGTAQLTVSGGLANSDIQAINGATTAADKLERGMRGTVSVTVGGGSSATAIIASSIDPTASVDNQFVGKVFTFADNTTTAQLRGQSGVVTGFTNSSSTFAFAASTFTVAPASGDVALVV